MTRSRLIGLVGVLIWAAGVAACAQDAIVGSWLARNEQMEVRAEFRADGRYSRSIRTAQANQAEAGTWRAGQGVLVLQPDGGGGAVQFRVQMPDANRLTATDAAGAGFEFVRQGGAAMPAPPPVPGPAATAADPTALPCPQGWTVCDIPMLGFRAYVPPGFVARLRSDLIFSVERPAGVSAAGAWIMPFQVKQGADAPRIAQQVDEYFKARAAQYQGQLTGQATRDRATLAYTALFSSQPCEGRIIVTLAAKGSMAYAYGAIAAQGRLAAELPVLDYISKSFAVYPPKAKWSTVRSPAGGFLIDLPQGWKLETTEGKLRKNEVDWMAYDERNPWARAFSFTPKFCSPRLAAQENYQRKGYRVGSFQRMEDCIRASLAQYFPQATLTAATVNEALTQAVTQHHAQMDQYLQRLKTGGRSMGAVYDCQATAQNGALNFTFKTRIDYELMAPGSEQTDVCLMGSMAPASQFLALSPVLERIAGSMVYAAEYRKMVDEAEAQRGQNLRATDAYCRKVEAEIIRNRFATQAYISRVWSDFWRGERSYVDKDGNIQAAKDDETEVRGNEVFHKQGNEDLGREPDIKDFMDGAGKNIDFSH